MVVSGVYAATLAVRDDAAKLRVLGVLGGAEGLRLLAVLAMARIYPKENLAAP